MGRNHTQTLHSIQMLCRMKQLDEKLLYARSRLILSIYRDVCWTTMDRVENVCDDLRYSCGSNLDTALVYLETFAPDEARERFEEKIRDLFETKWMIEMVDKAMTRIREYPRKGDLYCEILAKCYLNKFKYKESEMLEIMDMERSTYYDRKKEAVLLFGLALWGNAIPILKQFIVDLKTDYYI